MTDREFTAKMNGYAESYAKHANRFRYIYRRSAAVALIAGAFDGIIAVALDNALVAVAGMLFLATARLHIHYGDETWTRLMKKRELVFEDRDQTLRAAKEFDE